MVFIISFSTVILGLYILLLIAFWIGWRKPVPKIPAGTDSSSPFISVIIPFRDEEANLEPLLNSLTGQSYPRHLFEVIMIDDHSTDRGAAVVRDFGVASVINIVFLQADGSGKKDAIASGIPSARGEWILQTDADCVLPEDWIESMSTYMAHGAGLVIGAVNMIPREGFWSKFAALEFMSLQASGVALAKLGKPIMGSAANMAYRKSLWQKWKGEGSARHSGDDVFLIQAAQSSKTPVAFNADKNAIVKTAAPADFRELIHQRTRWGSKTPSYTSILARAIALEVALLAIWCMVLLVGGLFYNPLLQLFASVIGVKAVCDYFFLKSYSEATGQKSLMRIFPSSALVYPFYIMVTLGAMLLPNRWKGRVIR